MATRIFAALLAIASAACAQKQQAPGFERATYEGGTIEVVDGRTLVRVHGSPAEIGNQLGYLLKRQIRHLLDHYFASFLGDRREEAIAAAREMEKHIPAEYIEEMRALGNSAECSYEDILLANLAVEIYQLNMCSAVALRGSLTKDGTLLVGRNLDFPSLGVLERYSIVVEVQPKDGLRYVSVTWPGLVGVLSGMNEKGLAIANLVAFGEKRSIEGMPYMFLLRQALERCGTVNEATRSIQDASRTTANSLVVADASSCVAVLEASHEKVAIREIADDRIFATNNFVRSGEGVARCGRFRKLVQMTAEAKEPFDVAGIEKMLDEVNLCGMTIQSMVFVPERREIHLATGVAPASGTTFVKMRFWK